VPTGRSRDGRAAAGVAGAAGGVRARRGLCGAAKVWWSPSAAAARAPARNGPAARTAPKPCNSGLRGPHAPLPERDRIGYVEVQSPQPGCGHVRSPRRWSSQRFEGGAKPAITSATVTAHSRLALARSRAQSLLTPAITAMPMTIGREPCSTPWHCACGHASQGHVHPLAMPTAPTISACRPGLDPPLGRWLAGTRSRADVYPGSFRPVARPALGGGIDCGSLGSGAGRSRRRGGALGGGAATRATRPRVSPQTPLTLVPSPRCPFTRPPCAEVAASPDVAPPPPSRAVRSRRVEHA